MQGIRGTSKQLDSNRARPTATVAGTAVVAGAAIVCLLFGMGQAGRPGSSLTGSELRAAAIPAGAGDAAAGRWVFATMPEMNSVSGEDPARSAGEQSLGDGDAGLVSDAGRGDALALEDPRVEIAQRGERFFDNRPLVRTGSITMRVTAYSPDERSCGSQADGITASGFSVWTNGMRLVAADTALLPFGTLLSIPGYDDGAIVPVLDRGGAIKGHRLDVLFPTHEAAREWGVRDLEVEVWAYADE